MKFKKFALCAVVNRGVLNGEHHGLGRDDHGGVIATFSGPNAIWGKQFREAIDVYVAQHEMKSLLGNKVEFIYKDAGGPNADASKAAAQELLVREGEISGGF
ncbi:ABC transporter substrate-binding protein [Rhizobium beringeri]